MQSGIIENLDFLAKSLLLSVKGYAVNAIKYDRKFYQTLESLNESQWYSKEELKNHQDLKLRKLVAHAYENVPYYNELFNKQKIKPCEILTSEDLKKLPLLSKDVLRSRPDQFIAKNYSNRLLAPGWTTGTTGTPINALRSRESIMFENAILWRQRLWAGFDVKCRKVAVWGTIWDDVIVQSSIQRPPYWRRNFADNQLLFSYFHISEETLPLYFERMERFDPDFIEGFPSTILILSKYLTKHDQTFPVKNIFTTSEPLYDVHRSEIEERFKTCVFDHYGMSERVVAASDCPEHKGLHVHPEYGVFEIIKDGRDASLGEEGEIVGTGLNNYAMPLIRYSTGDIAKFSNDPCPCGRELPLLQSIDGRKADCVVTPCGRVIPGGGLMGAFHGIENIRTSQIVQHDIENLTVNIVKLRDDNAVDKSALISNLKKCVGEQIKIEVEVSDSTANGGGIKHRWVVSHVNVDK